MKDQSKNGKQMSRRGILPILGSALLMPFLGFGNTSEINNLTIPEEEEYKTLLKPDGTTVKVKISALKNSKVVEKNVSNTTFLNWLDKKF